ncbi:hypothetical protein ACFY97_09360 [Streptomyces klenkii]|uniref:hypothetical protein n=1 Tax=Streptomyces klenkii TaxID=1420899 RepID=UPI0036DFF70A
MLPRPLAGGVERAQEAPAERGQGVLDTAFRARARACALALDWVVLSPAGDFDHEGEPSGGYALAPADADSRITPGDFAHALLDEVGVPTLHRTHTGVSAA